MLSYTLFFNNNNLCWTNNERVMFVRISISVVVEVTDTSPITVIMTVTDMIVTTVLILLVLIPLFNIDHTVPDTVVTAVSVAVTVVVSVPVTES